MQDSQLLYKIAVTLIPGIGNITAKKLIAHLGSPEAVFKEKTKNLLKIPDIGKITVSKIKNAEVFDIAEKELEFIDQFKIDVLYYLDKAYPSRLKHCEDAPIVLFLKGRTDFENPKVISIVGTRSATKEGKEITEKLIREISERNHNAIIVSGLAYGIDITAHKASLANGLHTIAVLGHGLNTIYPSNHRNIAKKIIEQGALITEFLSIDAIDKTNFVKRNRIIAGLADATIVVESGEQGGALITADIANSYNRDVFAIPGKVTDVYSRGCNRLIKTNKAALIEDISDLEYLMGWTTTSNLNQPVQKKLFVQLSEDENKIVAILKEENDQAIDVICYKAEMPVSKVSPLLLNLEFSGLIKSLPGKVYRLVF